MADVTQSFRVSEDRKTEIEQLIKESGLPAKEWLDRVVTLYQKEKTKEISPDFAPDIKELEGHVYRINELVINMVKRSHNEKIFVQNQVDEIKRSKDQIIEDYQRKLNSAQMDAQQNREIADRIIEEKAQLLEEIKKLEKANENNQTLIDELREQKDTLSGMVAKYQGYMTENEELRQSRSELLSKIEEQQRQIQSLNQENTSLNERHAEEINNIKERHAVELDRAAERKEFEIERAVSKATKELQDRLLQEKEGHGKKVEELYSQLDRLRSVYDEKLLALQEENAKLKMQLDNKK